MKLLSQLAKSTHVLALLLLSLLALTPASQAAKDVDFSERELDQMLAPIALYPDTLLSQVLIASTYPLEVVQADRWVRSNKDLKTEDALKFAQGKDWDPSVKSLVAFPDLLQRMSDDTDWTQRLGDAFLSDEEAVMDSVQRLRHKAKASGNLSNAQYIRVEEDDDEIMIEPAQERVVYVPVYDTRVIYGSWWYPDYPPVYWHYPATYVYSSGFYWGPSIYIGSSYFYSSCRWRDRRVVVIDRDRYSGSRFYTGRSIVYHEGAQQWHHNPVHRHGVAYYNDDLRRSYNSNRPSAYTDRVYRERHDTPDRSPRLNDSQGDNRNGIGNNDRHFRDLRDRQPTQSTAGAITVNSGNVNSGDDHSRLQRIKNNRNNLQDDHPQQAQDTKQDSATTDENRDRADMLRERMERRQGDNNRQWNSNAAGNNGSNNNAWQDSNRFNNRGNRQDNDQGNNQENNQNNSNNREATPAWNRTPETNSYTARQHDDNDSSRLQRIQERNDIRVNQPERQVNRATELTPRPERDIQERRRPESRQDTRPQRPNRSDDKN